MSLIQNTPSIYLIRNMTFNWQPQSAVTVCLKVSRKDKIWQPKSFIIHHIKKEVPLTKIIHRIIQRRFIHINCRRSAACPLLRPRPPPPAPSALSLPSSSPAASHHQQQTHKSKFSPTTLETKPGNASGNRSRIAAGFGGPREWAFGFAQGLKFGSYLVC